MNRHVPLVVLCIAWFCSAGRGAAAGVGPGPLVCVGDSITAGEGVTADQCYVGLLRATAGRAVVADGRSGWTTGAFVDNAASSVALVPADAAVVTILLGTNDARSTDDPAVVADRAAAHVATLVGLYRAKAPAARFVIAGPPAIDVARLSDRLRQAGYGRQTVPRLAAIRAAYRAAAATLGANYADLSTVPSAGHTVDGVHPDPAGQAEVAAAVSAGLSFPAPGTLVCVGGSMTAGEAVTPAECYVGRLRARAAAAGIPLAVTADGRSGWSTGAFAANLPGVADRVPADATVVCLLLGTNDARSDDPPDVVARRAAANVSRLIAAYHARAPAARFLLCTPTAIDVPRLNDRLRKADYGPHSPVALAAIRDAYRSTAGRLGAAFVDLSDTLPPGRTVDGVHPDAAGHALIADAIWGQLAGLTSAGPATRPAVLAGKLVCVGASVTAGVGAPRPELSYVGRLKAKAAAAGGQLAVVGDGRSGWTTGDYLKHADAVVAKMPADATIVTFQLGGNDTRSHDAADVVARRAAADMERLIGLYRAKAPHARFVLLTPTAFDTAHESAALTKAGFTDQTPARLAAVADAYRALATRLDVGYVDLSTVPSPGHTVDGLHPDAVGHAEMADAIWAGLSALPPADGPATRP